MPCNARLLSAYAGTVDYEPPVLCTPDELTGGISNVE
jgi:hypothetical protein